MIEVIIPKEMFDIKRFKLLQKAQMAATALKVKRDFDKTTKTWTHRPTFSIQYHKDSVDVTTDNELYGLVDAGSPAHTIEPVRAKRLKFQSKYKAKTTPGVIGSKKGGKSGAVVTATVVRHPGFMARKFVETIRKNNEIPFYDGQDKAVSEANE